MVKNNKSVMIVHREGVGHWWKSWDGSRHYTDEFNFKNSLWHCIDQMGRMGNEVGVIFVDKEAHGIQDNPESFRPVGSLDIEVLVKNSDIFYQVKWLDIPECLHERVFTIMRLPKSITKVEFDMNDAEQFMLWLDIKLFGLEVFSEIKE